MEWRKSPISPRIDAEHNRIRERARTDPRRAMRGAIVGYGFIVERGHVPAYALPGAAAFEIVAVAGTCAPRRMRRVPFPCHSYEHAPVIKGVRHAPDTARMGRVRLVTLPREQKLPTLFPIHG